MTVLGVFAGGHGRRLMPLTADMPKVLVPLAEGRGTLDLIFESVGGLGIVDAYIMLGAHAEKVIERYGNMYAGMRLHYLIEDVPMGTLYAFSSFCAASSGDALLMNGDLVSSLDLKEFVGRSRSSSFLMDMAVRRMRSPYGIVNVEEGRVISFEEKPLLPAIMSAGIYHLKGPFRKYAEGPYDGKNVEETVFPKMAREGKIGAIMFEGFHASLDGQKDLDEIRSYLKSKPTPL